MMKALSAALFFLGMDWAGLDIGERYVVATTDG
jgi:hypothetical protein